MVHLIALTPASWLIQIYKRMEEVKDRIKISLLILQFIALTPLVEHCLVKSLSLPLSCRPICWFWSVCYLMFLMSWLESLTYSATLKNFGA